MTLKSKLTHVPVFVHIPKNAGTYIQGVMFRYLKRVMEAGGFLRKITVENELVNMTMFCNFKQDYWKTDPHMKPHPVSVFRGVINTRAGWCTVDTFKQYVVHDHFDILFCVAEPVSKPSNAVFDIRDTIYTIHDMLNEYDIKPINFLILRDAFTRQQSLYSYLCSDESVHEPSHNLLKAESFINFLNSNDLEDSWLVRSLTGTRHSTLNESLYAQACAFLDANHFHIQNINNTDQLITDVVDQCFASPLSSDDFEEPQHNKTKNKPGISLQDLDTDTRENFLNYTYWDRKLWERYLN